ncbi:MAG TPA: MFS transporter permease, partial [Rheinheimera sp.]|nr:MFS transporter permease [Rheinheimera sp.]
VAGLIAQPVITALSCAGWWQAQVFGIHADPSAITTLGLALMLLRGWRLWLVVAIPLFWLLLSSLTLWVLQATEAWLLFAVLAAVLISGLLLYRDSLRTNR